MGKSCARTLQLPVGVYVRDSADQNYLRKFCSDLDLILSWSNSSFTAFGGLCSSMSELTTATQKSESAACKEVR